MHRIVALMRKKIVLAVLAAVVVGVGAYAFAAGVNITSSSLGAGNASVAACTSATDSSYQSAFDSSVTGHYKVTQVRLTLPNGNTCAAGYHVSVTLEGTSNTTLDPYDLTATDLTNGYADVPLTVSSLPVTVAAHDVTGISLAISS